MFLKRILIFLIFSLMSVSVLADGFSNWVDFCRQERSLLAGMPTADKNAIADDISWLGGSATLIKIGGQVIDLRGLTQIFSENGFYSSFVPIAGGDKLYIEVDSEKVENIFSYLVESPSEDQLFSYLSKSEIEYLGSKVKQLGTTSAAFSVFASQLDVHSISCEESNKANDIKNLALLRFKFTPEGYEFYKRFEGDDIRGVMFGFNFRDKKVIETLYEIDQRFIIKMIYVSSRSDFLSGLLYESFLGRS